MFVLVGGVFMLVTSNVLCHGGGNREENANRRYHHTGQQILENFVDVFKPGLNGKPTLG